MNRRDFVAASAAVGLVLLLPRAAAAAQAEKKTFAIRHCSGTPIWA